MNKLVSIIVPIYNAEKFLDQCIESLVNQSYKNIEIILINDGSSDKSLEKCQKWQKIDKRIVLVSQKNQGVSMARNHGLNIAKGDYISFVDSDDYVDKTFIEKLIKEILKYNADMVECGLNVIDINDNIISVKSLKDKVIENKETLKLNFANLVDATDYIANKMIKKNIIGDLRFSSFKVSEDYEFLTYLYEKINKKVSLSEPLYNYHVYERKYEPLSFSLKEMDTINARKTTFNFYKQKGELELMYVTAVQILSRIMTWYNLATEEVKKELYRTFKIYYGYAIKAKTTVLKKIVRFIKFNAFIINPKLTVNIFKDRW